MPSVIEHLSASLVVCNPNWESLQFSGALKMKSTLHAASASFSKDYNILGARKISYRLHIHGRYVLRPPPSGSLKLDSTEPYRYCFFLYMRTYDKVEYVN